MKHLAIFSSLLGALCLAAPVTGWSDDHHHHHDGGGRSYGSYRPYCGPTVAFGYRRSPYYGYSPYSYSPAYSYYSAPSVDLSFSTAPRYGGYYRGDSPARDNDGDLAVDVQRALARRGYYHGAIDGEVGAGTRGAIREYQYRNHLEVTGRIDRSLLRSLGVG